MQCIKNLDQKCAKCDSKCSPLRKNDKKQLENVLVKCKIGNCESTVLKVCQIKEHNLEHHLKCPTKCDLDRCFREQDLKEHIKNECHVVRNQRESFNRSDSNVEMQSKLIDCQNRFD